MEEVEHRQRTLSPEQPPERGELGTQAGGRVLVTGSSGFLGRPLCTHLEHRGYTVIRLVRDRQRNSVNTAYWNPQEGILTCQLLEGLDAVIHLAGENVGSRWTQAKKKRIYDSRILSTSLLCRTLATLSRPPRVLLSSSATGYYGDRGNDVLTENAGAGTGFFAELCRDWEAETAPAAAAGIRVVLARSSVVLDPGGGMLKRLLPVFRLGAGGALGSGEQYLPWISLVDQLRALLFCLADDSLSGPVNLCAPNPVTNRDFTRLLAGVLGRPAALTVPPWALKLAVGDLAEQGLLASQRAIPQKLVDHGFEFQHPELEPLLRELLAKSD